MQKFQVAVLGLNSLFGQMSSLLLKQSRIVKRLSLYDDHNIDAALDISIINTGCKVEAFLGKENLNDALKGADIVLIGDDPLSTPHTCFDLMAPKICDYAKAISSSSPNAIVIVAASPVNILVPLLSEVIMECGNYDSNKILGSTAVDNSRANCILASHLNFSPQKVTLPVIGGASKETRIPLVSQAKPSLSLQRDLILKITDDIRNVDNYVFSLKKSPEALNKAYATVRFINIVFAGLKGEQNCVGIAFARTSHISEVEYFSLPIRFGRFGIQKTYGLPAVSTFEKDLIDASIVSLKAEIEQAKLFLKSKEITADLSFRKGIRSANLGSSEPISFKNNFVDSGIEVFENCFNTDSSEIFIKGKSIEIKRSKLDNQTLVNSSIEESDVGSTREIIKEHSENKLPVAEEESNPLHLTTNTLKFSSSYQNVNNNISDSSNAIFLNKENSRYSNKSLPFQNVVQENLLDTQSNNDCDHTTLLKIKNASPIIQAKDDTTDTNNLEFKKPLMVNNDTGKLDEISLRQNLKLNSNNLKSITDKVPSKLFQTTNGNLEKCFDRNIPNSKLDTTEVFYFKSNNLHTISELPKIDDEKVILSDGTGASKAAKHIKEVISKNQCKLATDKFSKNESLGSKRTITNTSTFGRSNLEGIRKNKFSQLLKDRINNNEFPVKLLKENYSKTAEKIDSPKSTFDKKKSIEEKNAILKCAQNLICDENIMTDFMAEQRKDFPIMCFSKKIFLEDLIKQVNEKAIEEEKTVSHLKSKKAKLTVNKQTNKLSELKVNNRLSNENGLIFSSEINNGFTKSDSVPNGAVPGKKAESDKTCLRKAIDNMVLEFQTKKLANKKEVDVKVNIKGPVSNQLLYHDMIKREKKSHLPVQNEFDDKHNFEQKHIFLRRPVAEEDENPKLLIPSYFSSNPCSKYNITEEKINLIKDNFKPSSKLRQMTEPKETHSVKPFAHPLKVNSKESFRSKENAMNSRFHASIKSLMKTSKTQKLPLNSETDKSSCYLKQRNANLKVPERREKFVIDKNSQKEDTVDYLINNLFEEVNCETFPSINRKNSNDGSICEFTIKEDKGINRKEILNTNESSNDVKLIETPNECAQNAHCFGEKHNNDVTHKISLSTSSKHCNFEEDMQNDVQKKSNQRITNISKTIPNLKLQKVEKKILNEERHQPSMTIDNQRIKTSRKCLVPENILKPQFVTKPKIKFEPKTTLNKFYLLVNKNIDTPAKLPLPSRSISGKRPKDTHIAQNYFSKEKDMTTKNQVKELFKKNNIVFSRTKGNQLQNFTLKKSHLPPVEQVGKQTEHKNSTHKNYSNSCKKSIDFPTPKVMNLQSSHCTEHKMTNMPLFSNERRMKNTSHLNFCKNYQSPPIAFTHKTIYSDKGETGYKNCVNEASLKLLKVKLDTNKFLSPSKITPRMVSDTRNVKTRQMNSVALFSTSSFHGRRKSPSRVIVDIIKERSKNNWHYPSSTKKNKCNNTNNESPFKMLNQNSNKKLFEPKISETKNEKLVTSGLKSNNNFISTCYPYNFFINKENNPQSVQNSKERTFTLSANKCDWKTTESNTISSMKKKENIGSHSTYHKSNVSTPKKHFLKPEKYFLKDHFQAKPYTSLVTSIGESTSTYIFRENVFKGRKFYHTNCENRVSCFSDSHLLPSSPISEKFKDSQPIEKLYKPFTKGSAGLEYNRTPILPPVNNLLERGY